MTIKYNVPVSNISVYDFCSVSAWLLLNVKAILVKKTVIFYTYEKSQYIAQMVGGRVVHSLL